MLFEKLDEEKKHFIQKKGDEKRSQDEKREKEEAIKFEQDFESAEAEAYEKEEEHKNKKFALEELKHAWEVEEDAGKKTTLEGQYNTAKGIFETLDKSVTERAKKWAKMQSSKKERDGLVKKAKAAKKKMLGDNVAAAKGEFEAA